MRARTLAGTSAAVAATAVSGALAPSPDSDWYRGLRKPPFQPPPAAFPLVWTPLYADVAVSSAAVLDSLAMAGRHHAADEFRRALGVNLALNAAWTWLFFRARRPWLATAECAVLAASSASLARRAGEVDRRAGAALAPYAAWTGFATVLSGSIAWLNRRSRR